jgi:CheY-like chemotaxis protein
MPDAAPKIAPSHPKRILVAEDDPLIRNLSVRALVRSGFDTDSAPDGAKAWQALDTQAYDLLITDHSMPHLTGLELIERIHSTRMEIPVIMVSGSLPEQEFRERSWLLPAAVLRKPYSLVELIQEVRRVLGLQPEGRVPSVSAIPG